MIAWMVNRAGRAALGIAAALLVVALATAYLGYRFASWPVRRLARDNPAAARRAALFGLVGAVGATVAVYRETRDRDEPDDDDEPAAEPDPGVGYTPLP
jgi:hypothetical protein